MPDQGMARRATDVMRGRDDGRGVGNVTDGTSGTADPDVASLPRPRASVRDADKGSRSGRPLRRIRNRTRLTGRAGVLALALCAVMVTVAYPLRQYLAQRAQISSVNQQNSVIEQQVAALQTELAKWSDPAYVAIQARQWLHYVRPGETGYIVPNPNPSDEPLGMPTPGQQTWYDRLWSTVKSPSPAPSASLSSSPSPKH